MDSQERLPDAELIAQARDAPELFAELYRHHSGAVFRYGASRLGGDAADDLTSEVFLVALERLDRYDRSVQSALPWLLGIATRLIRRSKRDEIAGWKALSALSGLGGEGSARNERDASGELDARLDAQAFSGALGAAVAQLPQRDRDVLTLAAWSELDSAGIAEALGIPEGTVRSRLHRSRRILRTQLDASRARTSETHHASEHAN